MEIYENMMENPIKMDDDPMTKIPWTYFWKSHLKMQNQMVQDAG